MVIGDVWKTVTMKITSPFLRHFHLDKRYSLLTGKCTKFLLDFFRMLDIHGRNGLNDLQFYHYMKAITDLSKKEIYLVFDMLDIDASGEIDFEEFYLLMSILIANQDKEEKQFIYRHSRMVFNLLDEDGSNTISAQEFGNFGFLFNFEGTAVKRIFQEFDVSGDQELDYKEFRMFAMACIDKQEELQRLKEEKLLKRLKKQKHRTRDKTLQKAAGDGEAGAGTFSVNGCAATCDGSISRCAVS